MRPLYSSCVVLLALASSWSCAAGAPATLDDAPIDPGGSAGASGTGGSAGTGGAGTAGSAGTAAANSGLILASGGPHAFPSSKKPASCVLTTSSTAAASTQSAYTQWKGKYVTSSGAGGALRVQDPQGGNRTVSEGIGYGMIASVYIGDRITFDGLWTYAQAHFDSLGLMNWQIDASGNVTGTGSATDGDEDMAWALIQASDQWNDASYLNAAIKMINAMFSTEIASDGMLKPGDMWGGSSNTYPDYFSPAYFRVFALVTARPSWNAVIDRNYAILQNVTGTYGLVPDQVNGTTYAAVQPNYSYDACRTPWRIGMDYCFNGEPRAKAYIDKIAGFFNGLGSAAAIHSGYTTAGAQLNNDPSNMAFIGPAGVSGMAATQTLLDNAFNYGANGTGGQDAYFPQSLRIVTMLMMSGNFVDFTRP